jgi:hypothetical protein
MCQLSIGHYLRQLSLDPVDYWLHNEVIADAFVTLARRYRFDGILVNLPGRVAHAERFVDYVERRGSDQFIHWRGDGVCRCPDGELPMHVEGPRPAVTDLDPELLYYEDPHTLGGLKYPFFYDLEPSEEFFPDSVFAILHLVLAQVGGELSVHSEVFSPFTQLMERLGYEQGLIALVEEPKRCHAILERFAMGASDLAARQAACGVDAVLISSAFAGAGFISRTMYQEFVLPYESQVVAAIHKAGVRAYTHTCGAIGDRLELMAQTGIDGIDTMDPPPLGDTDLADARRRVGDRLFLKGNLDSVNVLLRGSVEDVRRSALERLEAMRGAPGYILSSACSVAPAVPPENLMVLVEVAEQFA